METENQNEQWIKKNHIVIIGILALVVIIAMWCISYCYLKDMENEERGTFGDMFGAINSLFSGLALTGIILTILLQRQELKYQRKELSDTREEFKIQNQTLILQRFENTFFNLLSLHHQIVIGIDDIEMKMTKHQQNSFKQRIIGFDSSISSPPSINYISVNGRDVFKKYYNLLIDYINSAPGENYINIYMKHYESVQTDFGHYFRNLYRIVKFIDETTFDYDNPFIDFDVKYKYTSMVRAQLSDYELLWLFYNCLSPNGIQKFKPYVEKYSLLKNLPIDKLHFEDVVNLYKKSAFKKNEL